MRRAVTIAAAVALAFGVTGVGASAISLTGSDPAPGNGRATPACAGALIISHPISAVQNNVIDHVNVSGDMSLCGGQTLLLSVQLTGSVYSYAVYRFPDAGASSVDLMFNLVTGDFRDTLPVAVEGQLQPAGSRVEPVKAKDLVAVELTIGQTWE